MKKVLIIVMVVIGILLLIFINLDKVINFYAKAKSDPQCQVVASCCSSYCATIEEPSFDPSCLCEQFCMSPNLFEPVCKFKDGKCHEKLDSGLLKWYKNYKTEKLLKKKGFRVE